MPPSLQRRSATSMETIKYQSSHTSFQYVMEKKLKIEGRNRKRGGGGGGGGLGKARPLEPILYGR